MGRIKKMRIRDRIKDLWDGFKGTETRVATLVALGAFLWSVIWTITWALSQKADIKDLTKEYSDIVSREISGLKTEMNSFVKRNDEIVLDEMARRNIAGHANFNRAIADVYFRALDESCKAGYIFEINQVAGGVGKGVFVTDEIWKHGKGVDKGDSYLLTHQEKASVGARVEAYLAEAKNAGQGGGFLMKDIQEKVSYLVLRGSAVSDITRSLEHEIPYRTLYDEEKTEVLTPFAKMGAVIGYIGDRLKSPQ